MSRSTRALACLATLAVAAGAGCSDEGDGDAVAATVNGTEISAQDVVDELEAIRGNDLYLALLQDGAAQNGGAVLGDEEGTFDTAFVASQLSIRIQYAIIEHEVDARGIEVGQDCIDSTEADFVERFSGPGPDGAALDGQAVLDAFPADYRAYLLERDAALTALQGDLVGLPCVAADDAIESYYDADPERFTPRCLSVAQFGDPLAAEAFRTEVEAGGDFAEVGAALDPAVGAVTEIGCDSTAQVLEVFPGLIDLDAGDVSPVFLVQDTSAVLLVESIEDDARFADVADAVQQAIDGDIEEAFNTWYVGAVGAAEVDVDPRFGTWDPTGRTITRPVASGTTEPEAELVPDGG